MLTMKIEKKEVRKVNAAFSLSLLSLSPSSSPLPLATLKHRIHYFKTSADASSLATFFIIAICGVDFRWFLYQPEIRMRHQSTHMSRGQFNITPVNINLAFETKETAYTSIKRIVNRECGQKKVSQAIYHTCKY